MKPYPARHNVLSLLLLFLLLAGASGCAFTSVKRSKGIVYLPADVRTGKKEQSLNVFAAKRRKAPEDVFVFMYGGNWKRGKRSLYDFLGSRMARKHVVTVIVDYPKSPEAEYHEMATDVAIAVKWVRDNIERYGGNKNKIFVAGHSAGGHLAALVAVDDGYFNKLHMPNPVKGVILIDAAGLDMYGYMKDVDYGPDNSYLEIFTKDPDTWKKASPLFRLHKGMPPMLIYTGGKTYPSIAGSNRKFVTALTALNERPTYHVLKGKKHVGMITQFFNVYNPRYKQIIQFMKQQDTTLTQQRTR